MRENENGAVAVPNLQELAFFATEDRPRDGVYQRCSLRYELDGNSGIKQAGV